VTVCAVSSAQSVNFTEYPIPTAASSPSYVTAGPDGALWFTEYNGNKIGRITTGGVITEYVVPTVNSMPAGITAGPDGSILVKFIRERLDLSRIEGTSLAA
jgi:streptogramin lyase